jgi:hypothetical protein
MHMCIYICIYLHVNNNTDIGLYVCLQNNVYEYKCTCIYTYTCMYIDAYVYTTYIYIDIHECANIDTHSFNN